MGTVSWTSSNNSVASVNGGVVTAVGEGSAVITARVSGSVYATCNISVSSRPVSVTGVSISPSSLNLSTKSGSRTLDYTITPNGAKPSSLYWESSNSSVVTVDGSGKVTPVGAGSADITLTTDNGTKGTCHVTVTAPAQSIALSDKTLTLAIDQGTYTLTWTFSPKGSGGELVWTSDNAGVAKVDQKGVITPVSVGETDIRVKTDQNVTAVCHVVVKGTAKDLFAAGMPEITTCKAAGNTVLLTWNKYENADSYIILRRKMGESKFAKIATVKDLSYTDTAVSPSTPYYYSVQAVSTKWGGAIKSSYDKNFSVTTNVIAPTPTPAQTVKPKTPAVTVTAGKKQATLKWKKVSGAKGYNMMKQAFPSIVEPDFTANVESLLDMVEEGKVSWKTVVSNFYPDLEEAVKKAEEDLEKVQIRDEVSDVVCEQCGRNMVVKYGPHGKFLACPGFPECRNTKPYLEKIGVKCPKCGKEVVLRRSSKGRKFYSCEGYPDCDFISWKRPENPTENPVSVPVEKENK